MKVVATRSFMCWGTRREPISVPGWVVATRSVLLQPTHPDVTAPGVPGWVARRRRTILAPYSACPKEYDGQDTQRVHGNHPHPGDDSAALDCSIIEPPRMAAGKRSDQRLWVPETRQWSLTCRDGGRC